MNNSKLFLVISTFYRQGGAKSFRNFHSVQVLSQLQQPDINPAYDRSLFFTNLPNKRRERLVKKKKTDSIPSGTLIIDCKNKALNHYSGMHFGKFDVIPLASKGWKHRKSKGDYFTILPKHKYSPFITNEELPDTFERCGISQQLIDKLKEINVTHPTAIQAKVIPKLLSGQNVLMFAECGSGKTLAHITAMIENILKWKHQVPITVNSPLGIVVVNSRELAFQVMQLTSTLCSDLGLTCHSIVHGYFGKLIQDPQFMPMDILICTAPILLKLLKSKMCSTKYCKHVVVDDADAYEIEDKFQLINKVLAASKMVYTGLNAFDVSEKSAQICFVSAVAPSSLEGKLKDLVQLNDLPVISTPHLHHVLYNTPQQFVRVSSANLAEELLKIAKKNAKNKIPTVIFSNRNKTCNWSALFLKENGIDCITANINDLPTQRLENFRNFESGFVNVLCTTNFLSVGFNLPKVKHVVSLEFPKYMIDYIHRCGRVGRLCQDKGCLITNFVKRPYEVELVQKIEKAASKEGSSIKEGRKALEAD